VKPTAVLVDVDGTLVNVSSIRHFVAGPKRNFEAFHSASANCPPHPQAIAWVEDMADAGHQILVVTARMEKWRGLTQRWLDTHMTRAATELVMRADHDYRPDFQVKREIHDALAQRFTIAAACDDNPSIVALWNEIGIPVTVIPGWPG
jgi:phosphoglycolate phosphatase-like HAD superfamily hydrolase